jgi:hypothetical protein
MVPRGALIFAALLAALPAAAHHDTQTPDFEDAAGDAGAAAKWGDLTTGWFDVTATDITATLDVAELPQAGPPIYAWGVVVDVGNASFFWGAYFDTTPGVVGFVHGTWDRATNAALSLAPGNGTFTPGTPGNFSAVIPKSFIATTLQGLADNTTATQATAISGQVLTDDILGGGGLAVGTRMQVLDEAQGRDLFLGVGAAPSVGWRYVNDTAPTTQPGPEGPSGPQRTSGIEAFGTVAAGLLALAVLGHRR